MSADLDFGKLAFKFQGNFELDKKYEKLDCVYHDFSTYLAINTPNIGEMPSSSSDWVLLCKGYGLASEQEVVDGVVDNKAVSAKELKNNKATKDDIIAGTGDKIVTVENLISNKKMFTDWASPSSRYALMSSTGEIQRAPANGLLSVHFSMLTTNCWGAVRVYDTNGNQEYFEGVHPVYVATGGLGMCVPLAKNRAFTVTSGNMQVIAVKFIYYEGN